MEDAKYATEALQSASLGRNAAAPRRETPFSEFNDRLNEVRQRIIDTTAAARANADGLVGEAPEKLRSDVATAQRINPVHSGVLGNAFMALSNIEEVLGYLEEQVRRLNYIA